MLTRLRPSRHWGRVGAGNKGFLLLVLLCWLLSIVSYSPAGRETPLSLGAMDWIAILKVITRLLAVLLLGIALLRIRNTAPKRLVMWRLMPLAIFALWAMLSTIWSPLKVVSFGHGGEVFMFFMLAGLTGIVCVEDQHISTIYCSLSIITLFFSFLCLILWYAVPSTRVSIVADASVQRLWGFSQPNFWGHVAGVGLSIVIASFLIWKWTWSKLILIPSVSLHSWALFLAQSRTAIGTTLLVLCALVLFFGPRKVIVTCTLMCTVCLTIYLVMDPKAHLYERFHNRIVTYTMRGQTRDQFRSASGRIEELAVGTKSFMDSPLLGHGYYTMTRTGFANVWGEDRWHNPHNVYLHALTGTGMIGGFLLCWAFFRLLRPMWSNLRHRCAKRKTTTFVLMVLLWFFLLGLYELSFLGSVGPITVIFFVTLGIAAGNL